MKKFRWTYLLPAALALASAAALSSCSGKEGLPTVPFTLYVGVEPEVDETRAGTGVHTRVFEVGDMFDVAASTGVSPRNFTYTVISRGERECLVSSESSPTVQSGVVPSLTAYYPHGYTGGSYEVKQDQSTDEGYRASDYMTGSGKINGTPISNSFTINGQSVFLRPGEGRIVFQHKNAKVVVNATANSDLKITRIMLAPHEKFDMFGTYGVMMYDNSVGESIVHCAALLPPGTYSGTFLDIRTNKGSVSYALSSNKTLYQNYVYTLNIDVAHVNTTVGIMDWGNVLQPVGEPQWQ